MSAFFHFSERTPLPDIDLIYFEPTNINEFKEKKLEENLKSLIPYITDRGGPIQFVFLLVKLFGKRALGFKGNLFLCMVKGV